MVEHVFKFRGKYAEDVKDKFVALYPEFDVQRAAASNKKFRKLDQLQEDGCLAGRKF
jgi:hypothetical protein